MNRGEIWWVEDPEAGRRPHLILTRQSALAILNALIAVPATRTVRGIPTQVVVGPEDGMPQESALALDNLTLLPRAYFVERICRLNDARMRDVCRALGIATGCD